MIGGRITSSCYKVCTHAQTPPFDHFYSPYRLQTVLHIGCSFIIKISFILKPLGYQ
jgi:hypothetical protein